MLVLRVIGQLRDAGGHDYFSCLHTPSDAGNLEGGAFVECGEGRKGRAKIYPEIGERHHHMILSGLRTLEGVCSVFA